MESILTDMAEGAEFADELFDRILEFNLGWIRGAADLAVDAILFGDDWGHQTGLSPPNELLVATTTSKIVIKTSKILFTIALLRYSLF